MALTDSLTAGKASDREKMKAVSIEGPNFLDRVTIHYNSTAFDSTPAPDDTPSAWVRAQVDAAIQAALVLLNSPYLNWDDSRPETAVVGVALHGLEGSFVRMAPLLLTGSTVGACFTRKKESQKRTGQTVAVCPVCSPLWSGRLGRLTF